MTSVGVAGTRPSGPLASIAPIYGVVAVSYLGYAMMATLFVPMILGANSAYVPHDMPTESRALILGVLLMLYPLAQVVGSPILGALSDRLGRRPILIVSLAVTTFAYALVVFALATHSLWLLGLGLLICGLGEANAAIASSVIADATTATERPKYLGYMWSMTSVAYVLGPVLGGLLATSFGYTIPFAAMLLLLLLALIAVNWRFQETRQARISEEITQMTSSFGNLSTVFTDRPIRALYLANFLIFVAAMGYWRVITEYLVEVFRLNVGEVTIDYAVLSVAAGIGNLLIMPQLVGRIDMRKLSVIAVAIGAAAIALSLLPGPVWIPVGLGAAASMALAIAFSALGGLLSSKVGPERQGAVMGNNTALTFLGEAVGVLGGSALAGLDPALPMLLFAGLAACAVVILAGYRDPAEKLSPAPAESA